MREVVVMIGGGLAVAAEDGEGVYSWVVVLGGGEGKEDGKGKGGCRGGLAE